MFYIRSIIYAPFSYIIYTVYSSIGPATNTMVRGLDPGPYDTVVRIIGNTGPFIL